MPSPRDIRRRIKSVRNTAQITKAMQMVAASKMRKAQQMTLAARPFAQLLYRFQRYAATHAAEVRHPLLEAREVRRRAVILVGTDKGLCGALNSNLCRLAARHDPQSTLYITAGRRAAQFVARSRRQLVAEFAYGDAPRYPEAKAIAACAQDLFLKGEVDEVLVIATRFINTLNQQPISVLLLPIAEVQGLGAQSAELEAALAADTAPLSFEPGAESIVGDLMRLYLNVFLYRVLQEAKASEQSARMVAMKNATDNATTLIEELTLEYNKLRQGNITKELLEIAGGQLE
jgi:F-type H+-transporting ATPase subunit gamma